MASINTELKSAVLDMPLKEKDRLLLRLVAKDKLLIDQLQFKLVEEGLSIDSRRQVVQDKLDAIYRQNINNTNILFAEIKEAYSLIVWHVKVTKDKYGEVDLLLNLLFDPFDMKPHMFSDWKYSNERFCQFLAKKTKLLCNKFEAMNEEFKLDFAIKLDKLVKLLHSSSAGFFARESGVPNEIDF